MSKRFIRMIASLLVLTFTINIFNSNTHIAWAEENKELEYDANKEYTNTDFSTDITYDANLYEKVWVPEETVIEEELVPGHYEEKEVWVPETEKTVTEWVPDTYKTVKEWVPTTYKTVKEWVPETYKTVKEWVPETYKTVKEWVPETYKTVKEWVPTTYKTVKKWVSGYYKTAKEWVSGYYKTTKEWVSGYYKTVKKWIPKTVERVKCFIGGIFKWITKTVGGYYQTAKEWVSGYYKTTKEWVSGYYKTTKEWVSGYYETVKEKVAGYYKTVTEWVADTYTTVEKIIPGHYELVKKVASPIVTEELDEDKIFTSSSNESFINKIVGYIHVLLDIVGFFPSAGDIADVLNTGIYLVEQNWQDAFFSAIGFAIPLIGSAVATAFKSIVKYADEAAEVGKQVSKLGDLFGGISKVISKVEDGISSAIKFISNIVETISSKIKGSSIYKWLGSLKKTVDDVISAIDGAIGKGLDKIQEVADDILGRMKVAIGNEDGCIKLGDDVTEEVIEGTGNLNLKNIDEFIAGTKVFDDVVDDYSQIYGELIESNKTWSWDEDVLGADNLTAAQKKQIKQNAIDKGIIPDVKVTKVDGMTFGFADFEGAGVVVDTKQLPEALWLKSDQEQFNWLNEAIGGKQEGMTWHHTETPGKMELIPFGIHNITTHNGGRTAGMWADASR
jgi:hypothetical protein